MKKLITGLLLFIAFAFTDDNHIIWWKDSQKLQWTDFRAKPDKSSPYKALTESGIKIEIAAKGNDATIVLRTYFDKNNSWKKEENDNLLQHEQLHFDITELCTRKFRQKLDGKTFKISTFQSQLNAMHSEAFRESKQMQQQYDNDTDHSVKTAEQQKWNRKVAEEIKSLNAYSAEEVHCKLVK